MANRPPQPSRSPPGRSPVAAGRRPWPSNVIRRLRLGAFPHNAKPQAAFVAGNRGLHTVQLKGMHRTCLALALAVLACWLGPELRADNKSALADALALEKAVQDAIQQAEPSIACILVSRSDAYRELFGERPTPDKPGHLGAFSPTQAPHRAPPLQRRDDLQKDEATRKKCDLADPDNVPEAYGSGVVIDDKELLILTNYHVIRDATKIYVRLPGKKGSYADIHAADPRSDLAVLRLLDNSVRPIHKLNSGDGGSVRKGQFVIALANPFAAGFR